MIVRGIASSPTPDRDGYVVLPGACDMAIAVRGAEGIALLTDHDPARHAGCVLRLWQDGDSLMCEAWLDMRLKPGTRYGFSIGGRKRRFSRHDGVIRVRTVDLREISVTTSPRNPDCWFEAVRPPKALSFWDETLAELDARRAFTPQINLRLPPIRYEQEQVR